MTRFTRTVCVLAPAAAMIAASGLCVPAAEAGSTYRVVAASGDAAPGGGTFNFFAHPDMTEAGTVSFAAYLTSEVNPSGIWSEGVSGFNNLERVVREGDAVPGVANTFFGEFEPSFFSPNMNANGVSAFGARLVGDQTAFGGDVGVFVHDELGLDYVAMPGQVVNLGCEGICFNSLTSISNLPSISNTGQLAFHARVVGTGVNDDNDHVLFRGDAAGLEVVIREGDVPPNTWDVTFSGGFLNSPLIDDNGEITVRNYLIHDNGVDSYWSVWRGAPDSLEIVAAEDWATPAGGTFTGGMIGFGNLSSNNAGDVVFPQSIKFGEVTQGQGLWFREAGEGIETLCYEGYPAPDGMVFAYPNVWSAKVNGSGMMAFNATIDGPGINNTNDNVIVRRFANGFSQTVAQSGDQAPGLSPGTVFAGMGLASSLVLTDSGRVVFHQWLDGPGVNDGNNFSLWTTRAFDEPVLLIREGQKLIVNGEVKFVEAFTTPWGAGSQSGRRAPVNDRGQVALDVLFTDGTDAIVVVTPPADCPGDADGDYDVDSHDLNIVLAAFGTTGEPGMPGDLDLDGDCDSADLNIVLAHFGEQCLPPV